MYKMQKINLDIYNKSSIKSNQKYFDNLEDSVKEKYLVLYSKYSNMLYKYLINKIDLLKYDDLLKNSQEKFQKIATDKMDMYQLLASEFLNYLYIRNNIYIERLTEDEKIYLQNLSEYDESFIEKTYKRVILEMPDESSNMMTLFGPDDIKYFKPVNSLVIGIRYVKYDKDLNMDEEEWFKIHDRRMIVIDFLNSILTKKATSILNIPVVTQIYDDYSVNYALSIIDTDN